MRGGLVIAVALGGCATEYGLERVRVEPSEDLVLTGVPVPGDPAGAAEPLVPEPIDPVGPPGSDPGAFDSREVIIGGGERVAVVDYLFVVDSSSSMNAILDGVLDGFAALAEEDVFPAEARVGVMNTLPSDPLRPGTAHPRAKSRWWLKFEPGFGGLVDRERVAVFREVAPPQVAERFSHEACDGWFAPDAVNGEGVPCIVANTQVALFPVGVEAGLTALAQRLEHGAPLFRTGAAANVVFVSDTHDPGLPSTAPGFAELLAARPTFATLETLALSRQPLASFRVHAIAPAEVCSAEDWTGAGPAYFEAAQQSGGKTLDSCTARPEQYVELVRGVLVGGAVATRAVIPISADERVTEVLVDGVPTSFSLSADGRAVSLPSALPTARTRVELRSRRPSTAGQELP